MVTKPQKINAQIIQTSPVAEDVLEIRIKPDNNFSFNAGQFINVEFPNNIFRSYSLASNPSNSSIISIVVSVKHKGVGSDFFKQAKPKTQITFIGPSGRFVLSKKHPNQIYLFSTGTGIAPFIAMLHELNEKNSKAKIRLYFGARSEDKVFFKKALENFKNTFTNFDYYICLSDPTTRTVTANNPHTKTNSYSTNNYKKGRITKNINFSDFNEKNTSKTHFYVCGNPNMVDEVTKKLLEQKVSASNIFYEKFTKAVVK